MWGTPASPEGIAEAIRSHALSEERKCPPAQGHSRRGQEPLKVGDLYGFCDMTRWIYALPFSVSIEY
jgi:hypothetical protein